MSKQKLKTDSNSEAGVPTCPLCRFDNKNVTFFASDRRRNYFRCGVCELIFISPDQWLSPKDETAQYDYHQNSPEDEGYRSFLSKLFVPVNDRLSPNSNGLDFGCGPGPTLHLLFEEAGHHMKIYDPIYFANASALETQYDFITSSEVVEHLHHPREVFQQLWRLLRPGGLLGIMTQFVPPNIPFNTWFYKNDDTHVCFFCEFTMKHVASFLNAEVTLLPNIALFRKSSSTPEEVP